MKYLLYYLFFLCTVNIGYGQIIMDTLKDTRITAEDIRNIKFYVLEDDGIWRNRYDNGQVLCEGMLINKWSFRYFKRVKKLDGVWKCYSSTGELSRKAVYKRGKLIKISTF